ncbi:MAG: tRNA (N6-isopentenyl adenosine(37)-C2)-methylthiotransferase MiaB [Rickettsiales bacterium]|jgi:tRNA-2-methylthio-N6-dimethylallyladenosine synthase|nr:tRNA (N6-isopentenyl adenosine(37)-C2)-methylthiotransferase MiaB [Rickettsiales bacterium]
MKEIKTFFIHTFGCQMNEYDGQRIACTLRSLGAAQVDDIESADLIILNTCSVRAKASDKVFSYLGRIRDKKRPDALFGIVGCVAREEGANAFRRIPELNFVLGPQSYHRLPEILENPDARLLNIDLSGLEKFDALPAITESELVAYIPIQEGCDHCCTYCIVPFTRGREISREFDAVMLDIRNAVDGGAVEICFLGQNVNGYKYNLAKLIRAAAALDGIQRIRYTSSYPTEMTDELIALHGTEPKLLPFLNMPVQSGSESILKRMNRPYSLDEYLGIIGKFRAVNPRIQISSDFIVGFPGETDSDFAATMEIARRVGFVNSYSFKYSPRPHTAAAVMENQIPENVKKARLAELDAVLMESSLRFNESCVGQVLECLLEGPDKTKKHLIYRSPFMQQIVVPLTDGKVQPVARIMITGANRSSLRGENAK